MPTFVLVGIPVLVICGLAGLVAYERYTAGVEARKRTDHLKRWLHAQGPPPP